jgi:hypothetical protein
MSQAIHGKAAVLYLGANGGTAIFIAEQVDWSLDFDMAIVDVSPLNNKWKKFVKGMAGYTGAFAGNYDDSSNQLFLASLSDVAEKWYLYPNSLKMGNFYFGTAWVQLGKIAAGSTTAKASTGFKITGDGALSNV